MRKAKLKLVVLPLAVVALTSGAAKAADAYYLTPGVGTLGASVKGGYRWSENLGATGIVSGFSYSRNTTYAGVPGNARTKLFGAGVILDYYPLGGDLRVSGGLRYSGDQVTGSVTDSGTTVNYTAEANSVQPYLGLGYSLPVNRNLAIDLDVGAYYVGTTQVTANTSTSNANIQSAISQVRTDLNKSSFYPVGQLGLRFEF
jgi:hypothetical protein